jgi:hypothetical protein
MVFFKEFYVFVSWVSILFWKHFCHHHFYSINVEMISNLLSIFLLYFWEKYSKKDLYFWEKYSKKDLYFWEKYSKKDLYFWEKYSKKDLYFLEKYSKRLLFIWLLAAQNFSQRWKVLALWFLFSSLEFL